VIPRPAENEYVPYFAAYVAKAEDDPISQLARQAMSVRSLEAVGEASAEMPPAPGEWSLKEILVHLCDFERMFAYRALRFSRGDATPVEAFEQDDYVAASEANLRPLESLIEEFVVLRASTLLLFESFTADMLKRTGTAGGNPVSVLALVFITAGHSAGHLEDIARDYPVRE